MSTQKQIDANRRNAQKSTGPRTLQGKARSAMNALRSGIDATSQIIWGETPGELEHLKNEYRDQYRPSTPAQRMLVDTLIRLRVAPAAISPHRSPTLGGVYGTQDPQIGPWRGLPQEP